MHRGAQEPGVTLSCCNRHGPASWSRLRMHALEVVGRAGSRHAVAAAAAAPPQAHLDAGLAIGGHGVVLGVAAHHQVLGAAAPLGALEPARSRQWFTRCQGAGHWCAKQGSSTRATAAAAAAPAVVAIERIQRVTLHAHRDGSHVALGRRAARQRAGGAAQGAPHSVHTRCGITRGRRLAARHPVERGCHVESCEGPR